MIDVWFSMSVLSIIFYRVIGERIMWICTIGLGGATASCA